MCDVPGSRNSTSPSSGVRLRIICDMARMLRPSSSFHYTLLYSLCFLAFVHLHACATEPAKVDHSLKRHTGLIKRIRQSIATDNRDQILKDIDALSLERYIDEIAGAALEGVGRCRTEKDVWAAVEVGCSSLFHTCFHSDLCASPCWFFGYVDTCDVYGSCTDTRWVWADHMCTPPTLPGFVHAHDGESACKRPRGTVSGSVGRTSPRAAREGGHGTGITAAPCPPAMRGARPRRRDQRLSYTEWCRMDDESDQGAGTSFFLALLSAAERMSCARNVGVCGRWWLWWLFFF